MLHAYDPMREPRKEVSEDRMREILEKRCAEAGHPVRLEAPRAESAAGPAERSPTILVWEKPVHTRNASGELDGLGHQQTVCHRFVIAKVRMKPDEYVYSASMRRVNTAALALGSSKTAEGAREICQREANR